MRTEQSSAQRTARGYESTRVEEPPRIDGALSEQAWSDAEPTEGMIQSFPDPGKPASFPTRIWVLYDDEALYVGAHCQDPEPEQVVARITRRDRWIESDWFQVEIDSRQDKRNAFFFAVNAAGVKLDGTLYNENQESTDWDGVWEAETRVVDDGWTLEMRIPLRLLRFPASDDVAFGVNFARRISRLNEQTQWQFISPESGLRVSRYGKLNRMRLPASPMSAEVAPYVAARQDFHTDGDSTTDIRPFDVGVDAKLGLGSNFMLTMSANPDFGQVEVDQMVLNLSTIETYFPEKRTFFLEDRALFTTPKFGDGGPMAELFYTRRIGRAPRSPDLDDDEETVRDPKLPRIYGAAKLAGQTDSRLSVGLLQAVTSAESARVSGPDGSEYGRLAEPLTSFSILRLKQDFWENSAAGLMTTVMGTRDQGISVTGGTDLQLELFDGEYNLTLLTFFSHLTEERFQWQDDFTRSALEEDGPTGYGTTVTFWKKSGEHLVGAVGGSWRSPQLALNDVGYLDRPDLAFAFGWLQYRHFKPLGPIARINVNLNGWFYRNTDLDNLADGMNINGNMVFKNNWNAGGYFGYNPPTCDDRETRSDGEVLACSSRSQYNGAIWVYTDQRQVVSAGLEGNLFNTEHGAGGRAALTLMFNPASRIQLELIPAYQRKTGSVRWIDTEETAEGDRFLFADQHSEFWDVTLRGTVTFTTDLTLQAYAQVLMASVDHGTKYAPPETGLSRIHADDLIQADDVADDYDYKFENLNVSAVLRWEYLPGSVAYLVYTGAFGDDAEIADFRFGPAVGDLFGAQATHTLMLKLSYLWG
jgi:hypothetical protein